MTLEQVTRMKGSAYGIAGGIACLVIAYPYAFTTPKVGNPGPEVGFLFTAVGLALVVTAGVRSYVAGLIALAASFLVDYIMSGEGLLALLLDAGLVLVAAICFIIAGRVARKLRAAAAAPGASKP